MDVPLHIPIHTGYWWFDIVVYVVSGAAGLGVLWLLPRWVRTQIALWRSLREGD